jgi:hypothetical protein
MTDPTPEQKPEPKPLTELDVQRAMHYAMTTHLRERLIQETAKTFDTDRGEAMEILCSASPDQLLIWMREMPILGAPPSKGNPA